MAPSTPRRKSLEEYPSGDLSFTVTIKALNERFQLSSKRAQYQAEMQVRKKLITEGWAKFANDLRLLVERAFPDMPESVREQLALHKGSSGNFQMLQPESSCG